MSLLGVGNRLSYLENRAERTARYVATSRRGAHLTCPQRRIPGMHSTPRSPAPEAFHVRATGADVAGLLVDAPHDVDSAHRGEPAERLNLYDTACVWWGQWVAIAATGWGAVVVLVPLLAAYVAGALHLSWRRPGTSR